VKRKTETERLMDAAAEFCAAMQHRLLEQHEKGKRGWEKEYPSHSLAVEANKDTCTIINHSHQPPRKECIDVANRMMMLWLRGE
jgi:hypothetical protein